MDYVEKLLRFCADHSKALVELMKCDEMELAWLVAGMIEMWSDLHSEDPAEIAKFIAGMIADKHKEEE